MDEPDDPDRRPGFSLTVDVLPALLCGVGSAVELLIGGVPHGLVAPVVLCTSALCVALVLRRQAPLPASVLAGVLVFAVCIFEGGTRVSDALPHALFFGALLLAYSLGTHERPARGAIGVLALGLAGDGGSIHFVGAAITTLAPWLAGSALRSRRRVTHQLALRARELEAEREAFARESVRYERARIARELHDIVAHCVSVMVVQASAGQRLAARDPTLAVEALEHIAEAARQAQTEISRLVDLLSPAAPPDELVGLRLIDELVARAVATGLVVRCRFVGGHDHLGRSAAGAAYRIVQESLTNVLKHAPGAGVDITVTGDPRGVDIEVVNGPPPPSPSGPVHAGGGHGLAGMRERVAAVGGSLRSGPTGDGGWQVIARIPITRGADGSVIPEVDEAPSKAALTEDDAVTNPG